MKNFHGDKLSITPLKSFFKKTARFRQKLLFLNGTLFCQKLKLGKKNFKMKHDYSLGDAITNKG